MNQKRDILEVDRKDWQGLQDLLNDVRTLERTITNLREVVTVLDLRSREQEDEIYRLRLLVTKLGSEKPTLGSAPLKQEGALIDLETGERILKQRPDSADAEFLPENVIELAMTQTQTPWRR